MFIWNKLLDWSNAIDKASHYAVLDRELLLKYVLIWRINHIWYTYT